MPNFKPVVLVAEDDPGHASLIERNLLRGGLDNPILHFADGAAVLDFLFRRGTGRQREAHMAYVLLLDINMPIISGVEVLREMKQDPELRKIPVIILTTTDDPREVQSCHELGCNIYLIKPVEYNRFVESVRHLGLFLSQVEVPDINGC